MSQKKETFEIDGILFDYQDFTLAKMVVSEAILKYELHDKAIQANPKKGNRYIIGYCHDKNDIRVFNFSRMKNLKNTKENFQVNSDFNPANHFDKEIGIWLSATKKYTVELLISAEIGTFALERSWNKNQKIEQQEDGSVWVSFETTQLPEVKLWVLGQGKTVKVLEPDELIEQVKDELTMVLGMY